MSYLNIVEDTETGVVKLEAELLSSETCQLVCIRQFIVEKITKMLDPQCKKVTIMEESGGET